jgi:site-specific DNA recombinase
VDTSAEGQLIQYVKGYASKLEWERFRERSLRGRHARALQGKVHSLGSELCGWRRNKAAGVRVLYEPEALTVRRIFTLVADERRSYRAVARVFNTEGVTAPGGPGYLWNATTIMRIIRNSAYKGEAIAWRYQKMTKGK